jgi:hypothetical protein
MRIVSGAIAEGAIGAALKSDDLVFAGIICHDKYGAGIVFVVGFCSVKNRGRRTNSYHDRQQTMSYLDHFQLLGMTDRANALCDMNDESTSPEHEIAQLIGVEL